MCPRISSLKDMCVMRRAHRLALQPSRREPIPSHCSPAAESPSPRIAALPLRAHRLALSAPPIVAAALPRPRRPESAAAASREPPRPRAPIVWVGRPLRTMADAAAAAAKLTLSNTKVAVVESLPADPVRLSIQQLMAEQLKIRAQKKAIAQAMRNEKRKQSRLRKRARMMTDEDLVAVLMMRKQNGGSKQDASSASVAGNEAPSSSSGSVAASSSPAALPEERSPTAGTA